MLCLCGCCQKKKQWSPLPKVMYIPLICEGQQPLVAIGELRGVIYRTNKYINDRPMNYVHFFNQVFPKLLTNNDGNRLYISGGRYRVTNRGIQG